jgi:hypothetical protein
VFLRPTFALSAAMFSGRSRQVKLRGRWRQAARLRSEPTVSARGEAAAASHAGTVELSSHGLWRFLRSWPERSSVLSASGPTCRGPRRTRQPIPEMITTCVESVASIFASHGQPTQCQRHRITRLRCPSRGGQRVRRHMDPASANTTAPLDSAPFHPEPIVERPLSAMSQRYRHTQVRVGQPAVLC